MPGNNKEQKQLAMKNNHLFYYLAVASTNNVQHFLLCFWITTTPYSQWNIKRHDYITTTLFTNEDISKITKIND